MIPPTYCSQYLSSVCQQHHHLHHHTNLNPGSSGLASELGDTCYPELLLLSPCSWTMLGAGKLTLVPSTLQPASAVMPNECLSWTRPCTLLKISGLQAQTLHVSRTWDLAPAFISGFIFYLFPLFPSVPTGQLLKCLSFLEGTITPFEVLH